MAGAAKAPVARWRNCRRRRFMTMLPGHASGLMQDNSVTPRSQNQRKRAMIVLDACDLCWWLQTLWFSGLTATRGGDNQAGPRAAPSTAGFRTTARLA